MNENKIYCTVCRRYYLEKSIVYVPIQKSKRSGLVTIPYLCKRCYFSHTRIEKIRCGHCGDLIVRQQEDLCEKCKDQCRQRLNIAFHIPGV